MPYCTNCGEEVTEEQRYCSYCGEPVGDGHGSGSASGDRPARRRGDTARGERSRGDGPARERRGAPEDQRGRERYGQQPDPAMLPPRGTFQMYYDSLRKSVGLPAVLGLLAVAWGLTAAPPALPSSLGAIVVLVSIALGVLGAGTAYVFIDHQYRDEAVTVGKAARQTTGRVVSLAVLWLLFMLAFSVGLALLVVPGLYIGGRFLLAFPACVLDGEGALDSLSTSWELTRGDTLKPIGFLVAAFVVVLGLSFVLAIPQSLVYSTLDIGVNDAQTVEELVELASDPQFAAVNAAFTGLTMALPVAAVQVAAAEMYLENRYGVREQLV